MTWWVWLLFGIVLLLAELVTPSGFFVLFFGIAAILTGLLAATGLLHSLVLELALFGLLSVTSIFFFRRALLRHLKRMPASEVDAIVGQVAVAMDDIGLQQRGRAELRGTVWNAQNVGNTAIVAGQRCSVAQVEGLLLHITT